MLASSSPVPSVSAVSIAAARLPMGSSPGRQTMMRQLEPALSIKPLCSAGISPERTSEDFPVPELPITIRKRVVLSRLSSSSISCSRPKKRCSSSASKGRKPGKGFDSVFVLIDASIPSFRLSTWR